MVGIQPAANAYMQEPHICNAQTIQWKFSTDGGWTDAKKGWVRAAINTLDNELDYDGTGLVSITESTSSTATLVRILNQPMAEYGGSDCFATPQAWVNSNFSAAKFYYHVGRHEMFHLLGGSHSGLEDSRNGDNPATMATCIDWGNFSATNLLKQDDAAYLTWLHSSIADRQLHANIGFERGFTYWGQTNGTATVLGTGGATGPGNVSFLASGTELNSYIYQTVRLWTGGDNASYRSRINVKSPSSTYTTKAMARLYRQTLAESGDNECSYANGLSNPNDATTVGGYVILSETSVATIGTTWTALTGSWVNPANTDGLQLQIRAYGRSTNSSGINTPILFDNVRGEGQ
ncbi:MAG TPA: hypothetical protein VID03_07275 [Acidimicrobiia bacterium]|jgi:hypothetical protein